MVAQQVDKSERATQDRGVDKEGRATGQPGADAGAAQAPAPPPAALRATPGQGLLIGVWAYCEFKFQVNPEKGWTDVIDFTKGKKLSELTDELDKRKDRLKGRISKLAIIVHGQGGTLFLNPVLNSENIDMFSENLKKLDDYVVRKEGMLMLASCDAGEEDVGTDLLKKLSKYLPDRIIVGFTIPAQGYLTVAAVRARDGFFAGELRENPHNDQRKFTEKPFLTEDSPLYAKWIRNEQILRYPAVEELLKFRGERPREGPLHKRVRRPGAWKVSKAEYNGDNAPRLKGTVLEIGENSAIQLRKGKTSMWAGTYQYDHTVLPRHFDISYKSGKQKGATSLGISRFGLQGEYIDFQSLTLCLADPEMARPDGFVSPKKGKRLLLELKKEPAP